MGWSRDAVSAVAGDRSFSRAGSLKKVLWKSYGSLMEVLWKSYGSPMEVLWKSYGSPMEDRSCLQSREIELGSSRRDPASVLGSS